MCEIAVFDPERTEIEIAQQIAATFHEEQGDGIGIVAAEDCGDHFEYQTYKSTTPHWQTIYSFFKRVWDDSWRIVLHGRASTSGKTNRESAHPIHVDCDECDFDHVIHNGHVRQYETHQRSLENNGHTFSTEVDTEVIAHEVGSVPESVDDLSFSTYDISGNLNWLLFAEDGIFIRAQRKYELTDDCRMTCRLSDIEDHGFDEGANRWMVVRPGIDIECSEANYASFRSGNRSRTWPSSGGQARNHNAHSASNATHTSAPPSGRGGRDTDEADSGSVVLEYEDQMDFFDHVTAVKVAPGVMRVHDSEQNETTFVKKQENPKLYYFYAPEKEPEDELLERLEEVAESHRNPVDMILLQERGPSETEQDSEQTTLEELFEEEESREATARVVENVAEVDDAVDGLLPGDD